MSYLQKLLLWPAGPQSVLSWEGLQKWTGQLHDMLALDRGKDMVGPFEWLLQTYYLDWTMEMNSTSSRSQNVSTSFREKNQVIYSEYIFSKCKVYA